MDELARFAVMVVESGLAPKGMDKPASIAIAVEMGMEIGLSPMAAVQSIAVINGRPAVWGDVMLGLCKAQAAFDNEAFSETISGTGENMAATCIVRRHPDGKPVSKVFSVADAKKAGLWGKQGPWSQYPARMLQMRARSWALRDTFPDILKGLYSREEAWDIKVKQESKVESLFAESTATPELQLTAEEAALPPNPPTAEEVAEAEKELF